MEYKLIMAVSGFPGLYDSGSLTYRDLNMRSEAWRRVAEVVGVPESECRRKWKSLRDQHRRERQRERERRESGIGLFNYRPWRYSAILSFLNPFIDARAAGTNGWALDPPPSHLQVGCSTTTELRSDDDDNYGIAVADATTTTASSSSSSSYSEFVQRKRPSAGSGDAVRLKDAKTETPSDAAADTDTHAANAAAAANAVAQTQQAQHVQMKELLEMMMHSVTSLASCLASSHSSSSSSSDQSALLQNPSRLKTEEQEVVMREFLDQTDDDEDDVEDLTRDLTECPRPPRAKRKSSSGGDGLLEEFLRRMETRDTQRNRDRDQRDDVTLFLLSLAPAMRRLSSEKQSWVRTRIQQLLHEAEFGATSFH